MVSIIFQGAFAQEGADECDESSMLQTAGKLHVAKSQEGSIVGFSRIQEFRLCQCSDN